MSVGLIRKFFITLASFALVFTALPSTAESWQIRTWQTDEGLPENRISAISQSADGYLWVATLGGLVRFDGVRFVEMPTYHFTRQPNQNVRAMLHKDGRIWLAMDLSTLLYAHDGEVEKLHFADPTPNMAVRAMAADRDGNLWLARRNMIFCSENGVLKKIVPLDKSRVEGYSWIATDEQGEIWGANGHQVGVIRLGQFHPLLHLTETCLCLTAAQDGGLWIVTPKRVLRYKEGGQAEEITQLPKRSVVRALIEDQSGALWIGTLNAGLLRWDRGSMEKIAIPRPQITALTEDHEGSIWVGTDGGGLCRVRPRLFKMHNNESNLPRQAVQTLCEDAGGDIWAVLQYGALAREHDSKWQLLTEEDGWSGDTAVCVAPAAEGGVWIGTSVAGLFRWQNGIVAHYSDKNGFGIKAVRSLFSSVEGDLYIVTDWPNRLRRLRNGKLHEVTKAVAMEAIIAIEQTSDGSIWAGSSQGNLYRIADGKFNIESSAVPVVPSYIRSLCADHSTGGLWIGYGGSGLAYLKDGRYTNFTPEQGVHEHYISQIIDDKKGRLWIAGNRGIFHLRKDQLCKATHENQPHVQPTLLGHNEGLTNVQPIWQFCPTVWLRENGHLLLATANGVLELLPEQIRDNRVAPPLVLESIRVDGQTVARRSYGLETQDEGSLIFPEPHRLRSPLTLHPDHNRIEIDFTAPSFVSPQNMRLLYRMRNFDHKWFTVGSQRTAVYPRLPSGRYRFQIRACNESGIWNREFCGFDLQVTPFFWQTWWFSLLLWSGAALGLTGITLLAQQRRHLMMLRQVKQERAIEQERTRIARDMHDQLGSVLTKAGLITESLRHNFPNPNMPAHSLFEALRSTLNRLTTSMDELVWAVNPRHDTLDSLADYLIRYTQEFLLHSEIACKLDIPSNLPHIELGASLRHNLFLAFEEALNNVVKHAAATEITVRVKYQRNNVVLKVEDNGCGFDTDDLPANTNGVRNMRTRLQPFGGSCTIESDIGCGTFVCFVVPVSVL
jgi:signal transduction histidine kinase/ligand-binding sensor domain-containing protein